jgi:hypothetical protein
VIGSDSDSERALGETIQPAAGVGCLDGPGADEFAVHPGVQRGRHQVPFFAGRRPPAMRSTSWVLAACHRAKASLCALMTAPGAFAVVAMRRPARPRSAQSCRGAGVIGMQVERATQCRQHLRQLVHADRARIGFIRRCAPA